MAKYWPYFCKHFDDIGQVLVVENGPNVENNLSAQPHRCKCHSYLTTYRWKPSCKPSCYVYVGNMSCLLCECCVTVGLSVGEVIFQKVKFVSKKLCLDLQSVS